MHLYCSINTSQSDCQSRSKWCEDYKRLKSIFHSSFKWNVYSLFTRCIKKGTKSFWRYIKAIRVSRSMPAEFCRGKLARTTKRIRTQPIMCSQFANESSLELITRRNWLRSNFSLHFWFTRGACIHSAPVRDAISLSTQYPLPHSNYIYISPLMLQNKKKFAPCQSGVVKMGKFAIEYLCWHKFFFNIVVSYQFDEWVKGQRQFDGFSTSAYQHY